MSFALRQGLSYCLSNGRPVFMDLDADRYFGLSQAAEAAFLRLIDGGAAYGADRALLVRSNVLAAPGEEGSAAQPIERAQGDIEPDPRAGTIAVAEAVAAQLLMSRWLRRAGAAEILQRMRAPSRREELDRPLLEARARRIAAAFRASIMLVRASDRCLPRSIGLLSVCHRHRVFPTLVFGVRVDPFAAHCWVQLGPRVLTGDYDHVRLFTPIRAAP